VKENVTPEEKRLQETNAQDISEQENAECPAEDAESEELKTLRLEFEDNKSKAEEYYIRLQRLKAEFDNFRKRTQKEKEEAVKYASERVILSLLPVLDNFERAIDSTRINQDFESYSQGIAMIFKQLGKVLEDEGLKPIEAVGQEFDPNLHDALLQEESDQGENIILEEIQKGYYLKDKVIRPSKVKVSS
jgi:molecular chaperone GrpE